MLHDNENSVSFLPVLASGVPGHGARHDPGRVLRTDPPQLPHAAVAEAALCHLLFRFGVWSDPYASLGLAQWRLRGSYCTGELSVVDVLLFFCPFHCIHFG